MSRAIGTEIEEYHRIAVLNGGNRLAVRILDHHRFDEFISHAALVRILDRCDWISGSHSDRANQQIAGAPGPFPTLIAVHRIVTANNRRDAAAANLFSFILQRGDVIGR